MKKVINIPKHLYFCPSSSSHSAALSARAGYPILYCYNSVIFTRLVPLQPHE